MSTIDHLHWPTKRTFKLRNRELTVSLAPCSGKPSLGVTLQTDDNRCWTGIYPARPKLAQVLQGIHEIERQGEMIQFRARDLQAIRNWITEVSCVSGQK